MREKIYQRFLKYLIVNQYNISTADMKLNPAHKPIKPPIWDMYWINVIRSSLVYSNTVVDSKKNVTMAISFSYAS